MRRDRAYGLIIFLVFMVATLTDNSIVQLIGTALFLVVIVWNDFSTSFLIIMCLVPSLAMLEVPWIGVGLIGIGNCILSIRRRYVRFVNVNTIVLFGIVFGITFFRIVEGNFFDMILVLLVFGTYCLCLGIIKDESIEWKNIIYSFRYGCLLMIFGMIIQFVVKGASDGRLRALSDDSNYTAAILLVLFLISLFAYGYKIKLKNNFFYMIISILMATLTGSRGVMLGLGIACVFLATRGLIKKEERKITAFMGIAVLLLIVMYFLNIDFAVNLYDKTIGRTLNLKSNYQSGNFMDISSGRFFLWNYYWNEKIVSIKDLLFGTGFYNYYTIENGGYGLAAHNMYISGIIGVGLVGLFCMMMLYFLLWFRNGKKQSEKAFILIPLSIFIVYIFLDGLFDIRLIYYIFLTVSLTKVYKIQNVSQKS